MAKSKSKKHPKKTKPSSEICHGYDYAFPPKVAVVGPPEFPGLLGEAKVFAVAYGIGRHSELGDIPCVTLVGTNTDSLEKAFKEFERWTDQSDGDSVDLTFLFLRDGGYLGYCPRTHSSHI